MRTRSGLCALLIATSAHAAGNPPGTVGSVASSNGLTRDGYLQVRTPSILRVEPVPAVEPNARAAIEQYDRLVALNPDAATAAESLRRAADLRVQLADADSASGQGFHVADVRRAIAGYQRLLADYPQSPDNDRALYQLARAHQLIDEAEPAIAALHRLGTEYPQSVRAADADFRAGELLFARARYEEAAPSYARLLARGPDTPFYEHAQYKYAWALYKQSEYDAAASVFLAILDRDLPGGTLQDPDTALSGVARDKAERARESLRVAALCFAALGGGPALSAHFERATPASRMETLVYAALGRLLLDKERFTDAAGSYVAFVDRHPSHVRAPAFQTLAIAALRQGGFAEQALRAQQAFVARYAPDAAYWNGRERDAQVMAQVREHLDALARTQHAQAQQISEPAPRQAAYLLAADWYRRGLDGFPDDPRAAETELLLADALLEGGKVSEAARQYEHNAYAVPAHARAPLAALAAVQAWQRQVRETQGSAHADAQRASIAAALQLATSFPDHPQRTQVLMAAAEDQFELGELDPAAESAARVLQAHPEPALRRGALGVIADARYAQKRYADAEAAYQQLVPITDPSGEARLKALEQLASSVYRQAEVAREAGDLRAAALHFARVASVAPNSSIRAAADYDAASALFALEDWAPAATALEAFRSRHADHARVADADKKLALAYEKSQRPAQAAEALTRVALRDTESGQTRRVAAWSAAQLYEQAQLPEPNRRALLYYVSTYPQPLDPAMQARQRLAELSLAQHDRVAQRHWLDEIVRSDAAAGAARSASSQRYAAQASLEIGRLDAAQARGLMLVAPLEQSLARRRSATEISIRALERAAAYGFADITSAATYELASVYADLGRALLHSERPARLSGEALEQYGLLIEEQAYPFEEKAIEAHEINLSRLRNGLWNDDIRKSVTALGELSPGKYAKQERREATYDDLH